MKQRSTEQRNTHQCKLYTEAAFAKCSPVTSGIQITWRTCSKMFQILPQNLQLGSLGVGSGHVHFRPSTPVILIPRIDNDLPRRGMELITEQSPAVTQSHNPERCTGCCLRILWKRTWTHRTHPGSHEASIPIRKTRDKHTMCQVPMML